MPAFVIELLYFKKLRITNRKFRLVLTCGDRGPRNSRTRNDTALFLLVFKLNGRFMGKGKHFGNSKCSDTGWVGFPYQSVPEFYWIPGVCPTV